MRERIPLTVQQNITIEIHPDHITAIIWIDEKTSIGVRFNSPEHLLEFSTVMLNAAAKVWPNNEYIKEYLNA